MDALTKLKRTHADDQRRAYIVRRIYADAAGVTTQMTLDDGHVIVDAVDGKTMGFTATRGGIGQGRTYFAYDADGVALTGAHDTHKRAVDAVYAAYVDGVFADYKQQTR